MFRIQVPISSGHAVLRGRQDTADSAVGVTPRSRTPWGAGKRVVNQTTMDSEIQILSSLITFNGTIKVMNK